MSMYRMLTSALLHRFVKTETMYAFLRRQRFVFMVSAALASIVWCGQPGALAGQGNPSSEHLPGLVSKNQLTPPLRSRCQQVRFSPDGHYILAQDEAGIYILTREPLQSRFWIPAPDALPARFSSDARTVIVASRDLVITAWDLATGRLVTEKKLSPDDKCLGVSLSPEGDMLACEGVDFDLRILRTTTGERIFSDRFAALDTPLFLVSVWRSVEGPFSQPFGLRWGDSREFLLGRVDTSGQLHFSPDGRYFVADAPNRAAILVDIAGRKKAGVSGSLRHRLDGRVDFITNGEMAALDADKAGKIALIDFPGGETIEELPASASAFATTSDPRYLTFVPSGHEDFAIFDLEEKRSVEIPPQAAIDIHARELVGVSADDEVVLFQIGEKQPRARTILPLAPLPRLRVATVSPDLGSFALAVKRQGGVWELTSGARIERFSNLGGAWCADRSWCYLRLLPQVNQPGRIAKLDITNHSLSAAWQTSIKWDVSSGPVLLNYQLSRVPHLFSNFSTSSILFELRALDPGTGKQLWSRRFDEGAPVPFSDPQGERLVFAWKADSQGARDAAKHDPFAHKRLKSAKLKPQDTFFEVVDARSGKMLGGVLVQIGGGPEYFDSAFSARDWLILVKDGKRISVYSLSTGQESGRLVGYFPAISAESRSLAMSDGGDLSIYDLPTLNKRATYRFPTAVIYSHFSADGQRLFVLTLDQTAYTLDIFAAAKAPAP
jgi:hypothetical protein